MDKKILKDPVLKLTEPKEASKKDSPIKSSKPEQKPQSVHSDTDNTDKDSRTFRERFPRQLKKPDRYEDVPLKRKPKSFLSSLKEKLSPKKRSLSQSSNDSSKSKRKPTKQETKMGAQKSFHSPDFQTQTNILNSDDEEMIEIEKIPVAKGAIPKRLPKRTLSENYEKKPKKDKHKSDSSDSDVHMPEIEPLKQKQVPKQPEIIDTEMTSPIKQVEKQIEIPGARLGPPLLLPFIPPSKPQSTVSDDPSSIRAAQAKFNISPEILNPPQKEAKPSFQKPITLTPEVKTENKTEIQTPQIENRLQNIETPVKLNQPLTGHEAFKEALTTKYLESLNLRPMPTSTQTLSPLPSPIKNKDELNRSLQFEPQGPFPPLLSSPIKTTENIILPMTSTPEKIFIKASELKRTAGSSDPYPDLLINGKRFVHESKHSKTPQSILKAPNSRSKVSSNSPNVIHFDPDLEKIKVIPNRHDLKEEVRRSERPPQFVQNNLENQPNAPTSSPTFYDRFRNRARNIVPPLRYRDQDFSYTQQPITRKRTNEELSSSNDYVRRQLQLAKERNARLEALSKASSSRPFHGDFPLAQGQTQFTQSINKNPNYQSFDFTQKFINPFTQPLIQTQPLIETKTEILAPNLISPHPQSSSSSSNSGNPDLILSPSISTQPVSEHVAGPALAQPEPVVAKEPGDILINIPQEKEKESPKDIELIDLVTPVQSPQKKIIGKESENIITKSEPNAEVTNVINMIIDKIITEKNTTTPTTEISSQILDDILTKVIQETEIKNNKNTADQMNQIISEIIDKIVAKKELLPVVVPMTPPSSPRKLPAQVSASSRVSDIVNEIIDKSLSIDTEPESKTEQKRGFRTKSYHSGPLTVSNTMPSNIEDLYQLKPNPKRHRLPKSSHKPSSSSPNTASLWVTKYPKVKAQPQPAVPKPSSHALPYWDDSDDEISFQSNRNGPWRYRSPEDVFAVTIPQLVNPWDRPVPEPSKFKPSRSTKPSTMASPVKHLTSQFISDFPDPDPELERDEITHVNINGVCYPLDTGNTKIQTEQARLAAEAKEASKMFIVDETEKFLDSMQTQNVGQPKNKLEKVEEIYLFEAGNPDKEVRVRIDKPCNPSAVPDTSATLIFMDSDEPEPSDEPHYYLYDKTDPEVFYKVRIADEPETSDRPNPSHYIYDKTDPEILYKASAGNDSVTLRNDAPSPNEYFNIPVPDQSVHDIADNYDFPQLDQPDIEMEHQVLSDDPSERPSRKRKRKPKPSSRKETIRTEPIVTRTGRVSKPPQRYGFE